MRAAFLLSPSFITQGRMGQERQLSFRWNTLTLIGRHSRVNKNKSVKLHILQKISSFNLLCKYWQVDCWINQFHKRTPMQKANILFLLDCLYRHLLKTIRPKLHRLNQSGGGCIAPKLIPCWCMWYIFFLAKCKHSMALYPINLQTCFEDSCQTNVRIMWACWFLLEGVSQL